MRTHTISAVKPRPPARMIGSSSFLFKAAELKRFRSHPVKCIRCLHNAGWVGGLLKLRAKSLLTKMATARLCTLTLPPTGTMPDCAFHTAALCSPPKFHNVAYVCRGFHKFTFASIGSYKAPGPYDTLFHLEISYGSF